MLASVFGSMSAERVMLYLVTREDGYATEIARAFDTDLSPIQKQLDRLEKAELVQMRRVGRIKLYRLNSEHMLYKELKELVKKALTITSQQPLVDNQNGKKA